MRKILGNYWTQLILGLIVGISVAIVCYVFTILFYVKYTGWGFLTDGTVGDNSPLTLVIAILFAFLCITFPTLVWLFLYRYGNLKSASKWIRVISFIFFVPLLLWTYLGLGAFSKLQVAYENYRSMRDNCQIQNGVNRFTVGNTTLEEYECKNGIYNGFMKNYNSHGILIYKRFYVDGMLNGTEIGYFDDGKVEHKTTYKNGEREGPEIDYNEDGNTSAYGINTHGKYRGVYHQNPERILDITLTVAGQNNYCKNQAEYLSKGYSFICANNVINGEFKQYDSEGNLSERVGIKNGVINGVYETFLDGKLRNHLEFRNGKLDGRVAEYSFNGDGVLEYEGQYSNGLQYGIFRMYDYKGNVLAEVVFEDSQIVKINK